MSTQEEKLTAHKLIRCYVETTMNLQIGDLWYPDPIGMKSMFGDNLCKITAAVATLLDKDPSTLKKWEEELVLEEYRERVRRRLPSHEVIFPWEDEGSR